MKRARLILGVVAGVMLLASSAAHSTLGWQSLAEGLANTNVSSDLQTGLRIGWMFGGAAMVVLGVIAISTLVFSGIRNGLLSSPDMGVAGTDSYGNRFSWFQDQTTGLLEAPSIYSLPMWVYRALFFAWASWMAFALVRWLRWAFNAWKSNGLWR